MAVQLFAKTEYNASYYTDANFMTFGMALLTLFRFMTGEAWDIFMYDMSPSKPSCVVDPPYDPQYCGFFNREGCKPLNGCGNPGAIFPFLLSFTLIVTMVVFQLFVGVIIEGFSEANSMDKIVKTDDFRTFAEHWKKFDPAGSCYIHISSLAEFVMTLEPPLGYKDCWDLSEEFIHRRIAQFNVFIYNGCQIHFHVLLGALTSEAYMRKEGLVEYNTLYDAFKQEKMNKKRMIGASKLSIKDVSKNIEGSTFKAIDYHAARLLQKAWVRFKKNRSKNAVRNTTNKVIARKMTRTPSSHPLPSPSPPLPLPPPLPPTPSPLPPLSLSPVFPTHDLSFKAEGDLHTSRPKSSVLLAPATPSNQQVLPTRPEISSILRDDWFECLLEDIDPPASPLPIKVPSTGF